MDARARNVGHAFDTSDMDHDGYLDHRDMTVVATALCERLGLSEQGSRLVRNAYERVWRYAVRHIGTDSHGRISRESYIDYALAPERDRTEFVANVVWPITDALWDALDADGDGRLDRAEYLRLWAAYDVAAEASRESYDRLRGKKVSHVSKTGFAQAMYDYYYRSATAAPILGDG
ncbi:hypothetical protein [Nonomuraea sp. NPDC050786]|uniref:EF-hand domain-containing protein n=1 Tax=Nonomuraea sp. NPDC050786 TaxID=3154840 RepID=UPI0033F49F64